MSVIRKSTAVAAGQRITNVVEGSPFEIVPTAQNIQIAMTADDGDLTADISLGGRIVAQGLAIPQASAAGEGPKLDQDMLANEVSLPSERLVVAVTGGAAASNVRTFVNLTPIG